MKKKHKKDVITQGTLKLQEQKELCDVSKCLKKRIA